MGEGPQPRLPFDATLRLALGEGYPSRYLASLPSTWFGVCGIGSGVMRLETVQVTTGSGSVSRVDAQTLEINVADPEVLSIVARGDVTLTENTCAYAPGTVLGLDVVVNVSVKEIAGSRVRGPWRDRILVAPRSQRAANISGDWFSAVLVNADGEDFVADNADADAPVSVELFGVFEAEDAEPTSVFASNPPVSDHHAAIPVTTMAGPGDHDRPAHAWSDCCLQSGIGSGSGPPRGPVLSGIERVDGSTLGVGSEELDVGHAHQQAMAEAITVGRIGQRQDRMSNQADRVTVVACIDHRFRGLVHTGRTPP